MYAQLSQIQLGIGNDCRHAHAAIRAGYRDAVNICVLDSRKSADGFGNLAGGDVLSLAAKCVANAIDEIEKSLLVFAQQVASANPRIAGLEYVAKDLLLGCVNRGVAFKAAANVR